MPPEIMSSHLTSSSSSKRLSPVCCDHCGFGMAKILPPEPIRSTPVGKLDFATMLFGHLTQVTMAWLKRWLRFCQSFPATVMKAVFMGIAKGAYKVALAAVPLEKEEVIQRNDKMHSLEDGHLEHLILSNLESLVVNGFLGESPRQLLNSSNSTKMEKIQMEEDCMSEQYLINASNSFDTGNNWEDSSEDDLRQDNMESPEKFSQKWFKGCYNPQMFTKSLAIGGYFGENLKDSYPHCRKITDAGGGFCQGLGSPSVSLEHEEDYMTYNEQSTDNSADSPVCGKHLEFDKKDEDKASLNVGTPTVSHGFKSPLVLSLFYSPSEDEEEEEDEDEDWWNEDEMKESHQSQMSLEGGNSGKEERSLEVDDDHLHQDAPEKLSEPIFLNDPFCLVWSSKPTQLLDAPTIAPSEPKPYKEITVSFYLTKMDSKPEELCNLPKHPRHPKDPRANCRHSAHKCYWSSSREKCDPITTETPSISQEPNQVIKKVRFSPVVTIHPLIVWDYASRAARRGPWEEMARDRSRFSRRIAEVGAILQPCLEKEHRARAWRKMHGVLNAPDDTTTTPLSSSSGADKLRLQTES